MIDDKIFQIAIKQFKNGSESYLNVRALLQCSQLLLKLGYELNF